MSSYNVTDAGGKVHLIKDVTPTFSNDTVYMYGATATGRALIAWFYKPVAIVQVGEAVPPKQ